MPWVNPHKGTKKAEAKTTDARVRSIALNPAVHLGIMRVPFRATCKDPYSVGMAVQPVGNCAGEVQIRTISYHLGILLLDSVLF
jgi:hypothetical protein